MFIPLIRLLLQSLVSKSFLVCMSYSFHIFFLSSLLVWLCLLRKFSSICNFSSLQAFCFFSGSAVICLFQLHYYYYYCYFSSFSHQRQQVLSHGSSSDSKFLLVSWTLLSILSDLNNVVVWMVSTRPLISKFSSPCINPLVTVPRPPITICISVTFVIQIFIKFPCKVQVLIFLFFFFFFVFFFFSILHCGQPGQQSPQFGKFNFFFFFFFVTTMSGRLNEIRWSVCTLKSQRNLCVSLSRTDSGLCIYHLFVRSNFNFLHNSQLITLPTKSYLVLYSLWATLLHSLNMWLIVLSLSPHNLRLLICCILSILALILIDDYY